MSSAGGDETPQSARCVQDQQREDGTNEVNVGGHLDGQLPLENLNTAVVHLVKYLKYFSWPRFLNPEFKMFLANLLEK